MELIWPQILGVVVTLVAACLTAWNAHSANRNAALANRSQSDVAHRTTSLTELEKALNFTGIQLDELRTEVLEQQSQIRLLQEQHEKCEKDKRRLTWEVAGLKAKLNGPSGGST